MRLAPQKTCQLIIDTENQDWGALKGNHGNLHKSVQTNFVAEASYIDLSQGHGRLEKRVVRSAPLSMTSNRGQDEDTDSRRE